jgi:Zn-dependent protease
MKTTISLGRWFGVPVGLHYSWFVVAWLVALSLNSQFAALNRSWSPQTVWVLALVTAVLFFVCIVLHELAHATVARFSGVPVRGITLFALGGIAQIEKDAATPAKEFWMAVAGPVASFVIGIGCRAVASAAGWVAPRSTPSAFAAVLGWLAYINVALALFNLIPGFPLDSGRVLRSVVWAITHSADRATRIAARVGQIVAFIFIGGGLFSVLMRNDLGGLWIAFIGWFLLEGAQGLLPAVATLDDATRSSRPRCDGTRTRDGGRQYDAAAVRERSTLAGRCTLLRRQSRPSRGRPDHAR